MGDRDLIEALRRGRSEAWAELVERYLRLVVHVVRTTLATYVRSAADQDAEDLAHDLFASLVADDYRILGTIGPPYDLKAWLAVSARRRAIDFARKRRVPSRSLDETLPARNEPDASEANERQGLVQEMLKPLNPKERLVVQLFYLKGKRYREIARMTGINLNSISPTLLRAIEKMQRGITKQDPVP